MNLVVMTDILPLGHEYFGNLCGGFGSTLECEYPLDNGQRCGKSPFAHEYHSFLINEKLLKKEWDWVTNEICKNCGNGIQVMCFQGQDYCSENCRKDLEINNGARSGSDFS